MMKLLGQYLFRETPLTYYTMLDKIKFDVSRDRVTAAEKTGTIRSMRANKDW